MQNSVHFKCRQPWVDSRLIFNKEKKERSERSVEIAVRVVVILTNSLRNSHEVKERMRKASRKTALKISRIAIWIFKPPTCCFISNYFCFSYERQLHCQQGRFQLYLILVWNVRFSLEAKI